MKPIPLKREIRMTPDGRYVARWVTPFKIVKDPSRPIKMEMVAVETTEALVPPKQLEAPK